MEQLVVEADKYYGNPQCQGGGKHDDLPGGFAGLFRMLLSQEMPGYHSAARCQR